MTKILVVDDDPTILHLAERVLVAEGYEVVKAEDGALAMGLIMEQKFDVILLDIMMPRIDGFKVSQAVRTRNDKPRIPVVFVTARDDAAALKESFRSGGTMLLVKPFSAMQLVKVVRSVLPASAKEPVKSPPRK